jgi:hypothetical protein
VRDVLDTIESILLDLLDQKISEAQLLVPDNYGEAPPAAESAVWLAMLLIFYPPYFRNVCRTGKFVISVDDMMPQVIPMFFIDG